MQEHMTRTRTASHRVIELVAALLLLTVAVLASSATSAQATKRTGKIDHLTVAAPPADRTSDVQIVGTVTTKTQCSPADILCNGGWILTTGPAKVSCRQQAPQLERWRAWESPSLDSHNLTSHNVSWREDSSTQGTSVRVCLRPGSLFSWSLTAFAETVLPIPLPDAGPGSSPVGPDIRLEDSISLKYARRELRASLRSPRRTRLRVNCHRRVNVALVQCTATWIHHGDRAREKFDVSLKGDGDEVSIDRRRRSDEI